MPSELKDITAEQVRELAASRDECRWGKPQRFIENYLKIRNEDGNLVPLTFDSNQQYYYDYSFGELSDYYEGMRRLVVKDRKARSTTFWNACAFAFMVCVPGFVCANILDSDKNMRTVLTMMDTFYDNLPPWIGASKDHWDTEFREIVHNDANTGAKMSSIMVFSSARSKNFLRGHTPKMAIRSEKAHYERTFETEQDTALADSLPKNAWDVEESTPNGMDNAFYSHFRAINEEELAGKVLYRFCTDRIENQMTPNHTLARPAARGTLSFTEEEQSLVRQLNADIVPEDFVRWMRAYIARATADSYGDPQRGLALFKQEHPTDLVSCWYNIPNPALPPDVLRDLLEQCRPGIIDVPEPGMKRETWEKPHVGRAYLGFLDPARGVTGGDMLALQVLDAQTGVHVLQMAGHANVTRFTRMCCEIMKEYNNGLFGIEVTGNGWAALEVARDWGYDNLYHQPKKDIRNAREQTKWGWETTLKTRPLMHEAAWNGLFNGDLRTPSSELVQDMLQYNPDEDHIPDRFAAFMGAAAVRKEKGASLMRAVGERRRKPEMVESAPYR